MSETMQRDYIMRMIEQAIAGLVAIVLKAESGQFQQARSDLNAVCRNTVGLDLERVKKLTPDAVAELLASGGLLRFTRSIILAEVLLSDAEVQEKEENAPFPLANFVHAFCLIADSVSVLSHDDEARYRQKLIWLAERLAPYKDLPQLDVRYRRFLESA